MSPPGVEIPQQPTHAETDDDEEHRKIRQKKNSVVPQVDLLARADGQAIDNERRCSGRVVIGCSLGFHGCHIANVTWVFLVIAHKFEILEVNVLFY
jgi:hypothetical protein